MFSTITGRLSALWRQRESHGSDGPEPNPLLSIREQILAKLNPEKLLQEKEELERMSDEDLDAWLALAPPRRPAARAKRYLFFAHWGRSSTAAAAAKPAAVESMEVVTK
jgi:hypothetical protein